MRLGSDTLPLRRLRRITPTRGYDRREDVGVADFARYAYAEPGFEQDPTQMGAPKIGAAAMATGGVRPGGKVICFVD